MGVRQSGQPRGKRKTAAYCEIVRRVRKKKKRLQCVLCDVRNGCECGAIKVLVVEVCVGEKVCVIV